ncbi:MAG: type II toxin-antitoxin system PemK/MazF family toxin [Lentisphaeria bacterium]|nr:type II toxin-antitoxin system PemK/MazF family toxin [Lentisphaeria bacterium]
MKWAQAPGNVELSPRITGLPKKSVVNVSQIIALNRDLLTERVGKLPNDTLQLILSGIDTVLGR